MSMTAIITNMELISKIKDNITLDYANNFEPTDSEGWEMEGTVLYEGSEYGVFLSGYSKESYETQAAMQIAKQLYDKTHLLRKLR